MRGKKQFPQKKNQFALFSVSDFPRTSQTPALGLGLEPKQNVGHFSGPGPGPAKNKEAGSAVRSPRDTLTTDRV